MLTITCSISLIAPLGASTVQSMLTVTCSISLIAPLGASTFIVFQRNYIEYNCILSRLLNRCTDTAFI